MRPFLPLLLWVLWVLPATAIPWPEKYAENEDSRSPNGRYGIISPSRELDLTPYDRAPNYFVALEAHRVIAVLKDIDYCEGANHFSLRMQWSEDSTWGLLQFDARYGFIELTVLEIAGGKLTQTKLAAHIRKTLPGQGSESVYARLSEDRKLRLRVVSTDDPKMLHEDTAKFGLFQGTYDLRAHKWTVQDARRITYPQYEDLSTAYASSSFDDATFPTEEDQAKHLDERLNETYRALRMLLPAEKFARVKVVQIEWLRFFNAKAPAAERCRQLKARILELQELFW
jgi:uncharacterized protein YecT (DUF1311 family)